jgi:hypothetical protein
MLSSKSKLVLLSFALVLSLMSAGCRGFFVKPTLTTITVGPPTPSVQQGSTLQMAATGTFDDGSTKTLTSNVFWTSSDVTVAKISSGGLITAVSTGSATVTATSGTVSGSTTVTVTLANLVSIQVKPANSSIVGGTPVTFTAIGTTSTGQTEDITATVTWASSNQSVVTFNGNVANTTAVTTSTPVTITATSGNIQGQTTLTVTP